MPKQKKLLGQTKIYIYHYLKKASRTLFLTLNIFYFNIITFNTYFILYTQDLSQICITILDIWRTGCVMFMFYKAITLSINAQFDFLCLLCNLWENITILRFISSLHSLDFILYNFCFFPNIKLLNRL